MAEKIGIVHSTDSKMIRRVVIPDHVSQFDQESWLLAGESLLVVDGPASRAQLRRNIRDATGIDPPELVCAAVNSDTKLVEHMICGDPAIDTIDGYELIIAYPGPIGVGCSYDPATGLFWSAGYLQEKYIDKQTGEVIPGQWIPAAVIAKP